MIKDRIQARNPITDSWVKVNTKTGRVVAHKKDKKLYKNIISK